MYHISTSLYANFALIEEAESKVVLLNMLIASPDKLTLNLHWNLAKEEHALRETVYYIPGCHWAKVFRYGLQQQSSIFSRETTPKKKTINERSEKQRHIHKNTDTQVDRLKQIAQSQESLNNIWTETKSILTNAVSHNWYERKVETIDNRLHIVQNATGKQVNVTGP